MKLYGAIATARREVGWDGTIATIGFIVRGIDYEDAHHEATSHAQSHFSLQDTRYDTPKVHLSEVPQNWILQAAELIKKQKETD